MTAHLLAFPQPAGVSPVTRDGGQPQGFTPAARITPAAGGLPKFRYRALICLSLALVCQVPIALAVLWISGVLSW